MRIRPVVVACSLLALGAPVVASAQATIPAGIRQRAIEIGAIGRYTIFPDEVEVDNLFAGGGRLGVFIWQNLSIEGEVSFGVANTSRAGVPDSTQDVSHTLWDGRLLYNTPQRGRTSFQIGAGYGYDGFGRLRPNGVGPRGHGPTGLVGLRFFLTPRVNLRVDAGGLYVISEDEVRDQASVTADKKNRFEPSLRVGLSALFRNTAGPVSATTTTVVQSGRVDTVRVVSVDTVYRDRVQQATTGGAAAATGATGTGASATVVIGVVNFDFDKAELSSDARRILDDVATSLTKPEATRLRLILTGNTDAIGGESYNNRLSERRAAAVADYLASKGIGADRITQRAAGEGNPVASNNNPEGRVARAPVARAPFAGAPFA
jgi:outer membrane protein OmpA-like peptidoglycan-associated protein